MQPQTDKHIVWITQTRTSPDMMMTATCSTGKMFKWNKLPEKGIAGSKIRMRYICASFIDFLICSLEDWKLRQFFLKVVQWKKKKICVFAAAEHLLNTEGNWKETFSVSSIWNWRGVKEGREWKCQFLSQQRTKEKILWQSRTLKLGALRLQAAACLAVMMQPLR